MIHSASVGAISFQHAYRVQSLLSSFRPVRVCGCVCVSLYVCTEFPYVCARERLIVCIRTPLPRVSVAIYVMNEFQVSAADTFLRRSRSRGNYFGSMADTRGPLYLTRFRCEACILSQKVLVRTRRWARNFYENMRPFLIRKYIFNII